MSKVRLGSLAVLLIALLVVLGTVLKGNVSRETVDPQSYRTAMKICINQRTFEEMAEDNANGDFQQCVQDTAVQISAFKDAVKSCVGKRSFDEAVGGNGSEILQECIEKTLDY